LLPTISIRNVKLNKNKMNLQVKNLIDKTKTLINELREDRENCKTKEGWDAISTIITEKRELINELNDCL